MSAHVWVVETYEMVRGRKVWAADRWVNYTFRTRREALHALKRELRRSLYERHWYRVRKYVRSSP